MKNLLLTAWRATLGPAYYRLVVLRFETLDAHIGQSALAQQAEIDGFTARLEDKLSALTANTLELSELVALVQQRLETREGHSDQIAEAQQLISSRMETVERRTEALTEAFSALDRHVRVVVAARWDEAAITRRLAHIEDRLDGSEVTAPAAESDHV